MSAPGSMIGRELAQYRIVESIGAGGMGEVYRAHDTRLDRDVALKVLPPGSLADEAARKRFRKEAHALSRLSHPHIASLFDFDTSEDGTDFLVMELVGGPSLDTKLKHGPLPEKEVVRLGAQIVRALVAAHERGIVHRDLKPQNVRLTADGLVKVLDFGLARVAPVVSEAATTDTASGIVAGTPPYMSPEQLLGKEVDARTDVYAAGVVLYELSTGRRPYGAASGPQLVAKILSEPMPAPREINATLSPQLEQVIVKAADKDRELRHQTAKELLVDLERLAAGRAPSAAWAKQDEATGSTPPKVRQRAWLRRGLWLIGAATLVAAAFILLSSLRPATPRIVSFRTIAHRSHAFSGLATDGRNAYFAEMREPTDELFAVSLSGGEPRQIPVPWSGRLDLEVVGLLPGPPALLVGRGAPATGGRAERELWRLPLEGGNPSRVGRLPPVLSAALSRGGDRIAYVESLADAKGFAIGVAQADGSGPRRIHEGKAFVAIQGWRPGDRSMRLLSTDDTLRFWDVPADGSRAPTRVEPPGKGALWPSRPEWTPDGRFFLYVDDEVLFARREGIRSWGSREPAPIRLAAPPNVVDLRFTPDGSHIVALVDRPGTEVVRFDERTTEVTPLLAGARAGVAEFSPDGDWVAWVSYDGTRGRLWRSRPDGSAALQLTDTARFDVTPWAPVRWSPDGRRIAFSAWGDPLEESSSPELFVADVETGTVERPRERERGATQIDPCWMPDEQVLAYAPIGEPGVHIRLIHLGTREVTKLQGSEGLCGPRCSRDGRILAYDWLSQRDEKGQRSHFKVREAAGGRWRPLAIDVPGLRYPTWSRDGRYVYATASSLEEKAVDRHLPGLPAREIVRFDVATGRVEHLGRIDGLQADAWIELTPDGAPMVHRDVSQREVVVMDWEVR